MTTTIRDRIVPEAGSDPVTHSEPRVPLDPPDASSEGIAPHRVPGWDDPVMASEFTVVTRTRHPAARLFDVSLSIDAHIGSMARSGEWAVAGVTSGRIGLGQTVTWRARHFGVWFTMTSRIVELEQSRRFVDEQVSGPFRSFHHEHVFDEGDEGTVMTDRITLASPILGRLVERTILVPYLRRLIEQRNRHLVDSLDA
ncbi:SRPBCC family protein [Microbacterium sp. 18062]|uniref:SRPBCC family protein n=1 Tax=Microbacterium sp. 18062 TaxID=2681410 RepID=UPI0027D2896C|nr:SRPBCC family protein [Microbacterium sp. 18062]